MTTPRSGRSRVRRRTSGVTTAGSTPGIVCSGVAFHLPNLTIIGSAETAVRSSRLSGLYQPVVLSYVSVSALSFVGQVGGLTFTDPRPVPLAFVRSEKHWVKSAAAEMSAPPTAIVLR